MAVSTDPAVSVLITEVRSLTRELQRQRLEREKKCIASRELKSNSLTYFSLWKRLFLQLRGIEADELVFIKACAYADPQIKRCGYQGLAFMDERPSAILMINTVMKDLESGSFYGDALAFLANCSDYPSRFNEISSHIKAVPEAHAHHTKYIVAKSKLQHELFFSMLSNKDAVLLAKLQVVLDHGDAEKLSQNDLMFLNDRVYSTRCKFTLIKLLRMYSALYKIGKFTVNGRLFEFLRSLVIDQATRATKQLDIGLSLESCRLLAETSNFCDRAEGFIFRLINSENPNSRHLAFGFAVEYDVMAELVVDRIVKLGAHHYSHLEILRSLLNKSNYKRIYKMRDEIIHYVVKDVIDLKKAEEVTTGLLTRIAELSDLEFLCKILVENPKIYKEIRNKTLLFPEQIRQLFKSIVQKDDIECFSIIYDMMPSKINDAGIVASLACRHLEILTGGEASARKLELLDELFDVLCVHGDIPENRALVTEAYRRACAEQLPHALKEKLLSGVLLFNLVLDSKRVHVEDDIFVEYSIADGRLQVTHEVECMRVFVRYNNELLELCMEPRGSGFAGTFLLGNEDTFALVVRVHDRCVEKRIVMH